MATLDEKNTYYIDYATGAGNFEFTGTLDAMILLISLGMELKHQKMT